MTDLHLLKSAGGHKYGCVLLSLSEAAADILRSWAVANIPDSDLAEDGRDKSPHVTVLYGLTEPPAQATQTVAAKLATNGPVAVPVGEVSIFETPKYDVVKVDVGSPGLRRMNRLLKQVPHVDTHPEFKPHITLAYVKKGEGKKYVGMKTPLYGDALAFARAIYSAPDKTTSIVRLGVAPTQRLMVKANNGGSEYWRTEPRDWQGRWQRSYADAIEGWTAEKTDRDTGYGPLWKIRDANGTEITSAAGHTEVSAKLRAASYLEQAGRLKQYQGKSPFDLHGAPGRVERLFEQDFGFRHVHAFDEGWDTSQGQAQIAKAHQAFRDLAIATGTPDRFCSLNGRIGLAFLQKLFSSQRISGQFNKEQRRINLNGDVNGATLAHEWAHALDHHLGQQLRLLAPRVQQFQHPHFSATQMGEFYIDLSPDHELWPIYRELAGVMSLIGKSPRPEKSMFTSALEWERDLGDQTTPGYLRQSEELFARAFESYVADKLYSKGHTDSDSTPALDVWNKFAPGLYLERGSEYERDICTAFDRLFAEIRRTGFFEKALKLHGRTEFQGLPISIENRKGSIRSGVNQDGEEWQSKMFHAYGYIRGTVGVDGDHVDCFIGPNPKSRTVFVIHQKNPQTKAYDEDKCMLGFDDEISARDAFLACYDDWRFLGPITTMDIDEFKRKIENKGQMVKAHDVSKEPRNAHGEWSAIPGAAEVETFENRVRNAIQVLARSSKSSAENIVKQTGLSPKDAMKAIDSLLRQNKITRDGKIFRLGGKIAGSASDLVMSGPSKQTGFDFGKSVRPRLVLRKAFKVSAKRQAELQAAHAAQSAARTESLAHELKARAEKATDPEDRSIWQEQLDEHLARNPHLKAKFDPAKHPRADAGAAGKYRGGQFVPWKVTGAQLNRRLAAADTSHLATERVEDWGSGRGQGKRSGGMVRGAMGDPPRGKKTYRNPVGALPAEEGKEAMLAFGDSQHGDLDTYARARALGMDHDDAMLLTYRDGGGHEAVVLRAQRMGHKVPAKVLAEYDKEFARAPGIVPDDIPVSVRQAIITANSPNTTLEGYIRARGKGRGTYEWEADHKEAHDQRTESAHKLIARAQEAAQSNGWDWPGIVEKVRTDAKLSEDWRTPDEARLKQKEEEYKESFKQRHPTDYALTDGADWEHQYRTKYLPGLSASGLVSERSRVAEKAKKATAARKPYWTQRMDWLSEEEIKRSGKAAGPAKPATVASPTPKAKPVPAPKAPAVPASATYPKIVDDTDWMENPTKPGGNPEARLKAMMKKNGFGDVTFTQPPGTEIKVGGPRRYHDDTGHFVRTGGRKLNESQHRTRAMATMLQAMTRMQQAIRFRGDLVQGKPPLSFTIGKIEQEDPLRGKRSPLSRVAACYYPSKNHVDIDANHPTSFFHETAHYLDYAAGSRHSDSRYPYAATEIHGGEWQKFTDDLRRTDAHLRFSRSVSGQSDYVNSPKEVLARFFEEWVTHELKKKGVGVGHLNGGNQFGTHNENYTYAELEKFGRSFKSLLRKDGLLKAVNAFLGAFEAPDLTCDQTKTFLSLLDDSGQREGNGNRARAIRAHIFPTLRKAVHRYGLTCPEWLLKQPGG